MEKIVSSTSDEELDFSLHNIHSRSPPGEELSIDLHRLKVLIQSSQQWRTINNQKEHSKWNIHRLKWRSHHNFSTGRNMLSDSNKPNIDCLRLFLSSYYSDDGHDNPNNSIDEKERNIINNEEMFISNEKIVVPHRYDEESMTKTYQNGSNILPMISFNCNQIIECEKQQQQHIMLNSPSISAKNGLEELSLRYSVIESDMKLWSLKATPKCATNIYYNNRKNSVSTSSILCSINDTATSCDVTSSSFNTMNSISSWKNDNFHHTNYVGLLQLGKLLMNDFDCTSISDTKQICHHRMEESIINNKKPMIRKHEKWIIRNENYYKKYYRLQITIIITVLFVVWLNRFFIHNCYLTIDSADDDIHNSIIWSTNHRQYYYYERNGTTTINTRWIDDLIPFVVPMQSSDYWVWSHYTPYINEYSQSNHLQEMKELRTSSTFSVNLSHRMNILTSNFTTFLVGDLVLNNDTANDSSNYTIKSDHDIFESFLRQNKQSSSSSYLITNNETYCSSFSRTILNNTTSFVYQNNNNQQSSTPLKNLLLSICHGIGYHLHGKIGFRQRKINNNK